MCQPKRWLWGLLPLALLWLVAGFLRHDSIQTDLTTRSVNEALKANAPWASAVFDGRDATVTGISPTTAGQKAAEEAVASVFGVRKIEDRTTLLAEAKPYIWSAAREANKLTLGGFVPDEATRAKLIADTRAALPNTEVVDQLRLARGVPAVFGAATAYALAQLARLPDGKASLSDSVLSITGTAPSLEAFQAASAAALPQGVSGSVTVGLPVVRPYLWQAQKAGQVITLTGFVPSAELKARLAEAAKAAAPSATINDQTRLAAGAPAGLEALATAAFGHLAALTSGIASLTDGAYIVTGDASSSALRDELLAALARIPAGFTVARQDIAAPAPVVVAPPAPPPLPLVPIPATPAPPGTVESCQQQFNMLLDEPILFDSDKETIRSESYLLLGRLATIAKSCLTYSIEISAHTDADGTTAYNLDLSERRAQAVREYLLREGVAGTNLKAVGYGETKPIAPNDTPENKQKNRRVEFTVK